MPAAESYPDDLRYHREHDWARLDGDTATFGVTWYAQDSLGDLVVYLPPEVGAEVAAGGEYGELESVKAVSGIVAPLSGTVTEVNQAVIDAPELVNDDPYGQGWLIRVRLANPDERRRPARRGRLRALTWRACSDARAWPISSARSRSPAGTSGPRPRIRSACSRCSATPRSTSSRAPPCRASILLGADLDLPEALPEIDVLAELRALGHRNRVMTTMIGLGYYGTHTPQVVLRKVLENPAWYTAYTPYQPEISQGRLEALLNYQTMVCDLTALPVANASLLDEATAAAEAMTVARRSSKAASQRFVVDADVLSADARDARRRAPSRSASRSSSPISPTGLPEGGCFGVLAQYPGRERSRARPRAARRGGPRARARWPASPPTCSRSCCSSRRARWAPTSSSAHRSASASRSASAARTPPT